MSEIETSSELQPESGPVERPQGRPIESRFLYVDVAAARAKQLRKGAKVRLDPGASKAAKPERLAMEEVNHQLVEWDLPEFVVPTDNKR